MSSREAVLASLFISLAAVCLLTAAVIRGTLFGEDTPLHTRAESERHCPDKPEDPPRPAEAAASGRETGAKPVAASTAAKPDRRRSEESVDTLAALRGGALLLPVHEVGLDQLSDSFDEERSGDRRHQAIDILASRGTPVLATTSGTIVRLAESALGGKTIYQYDEDESYCFYYAHLQRYANGLEAGDRVRRGQVIGYVGSTGNAPEDTPHLHFAVFPLDDSGTWGLAEPVNPYELLTQALAATPS